MAVEEHQDCTHWLEEAEVGCKDGTYHKRKKRKDIKKMVPSVFRQREIRKMVPTSLLPLRASQQAPVPQTNALRLANEPLSRKHSTLFKGLLLPSALGPVSLCMGPLRAIPWLTMGLWGPCPVGLQSQTLFRLFSQVLILKVGVTVVGYQTFALRKKLRVLRFLLIMGRGTLGGVCG